jgi:hypothetical protein
MTIINLNFILGQTERDLNDLSQFVMQMKIIKIDVFIKILKREKVNFTDSHLQGKLRPFTLVKNFFFWDLQTVTVMMPKRFLFRHGRVVNSHFLIELRNFDNGPNFLCKPLHSRYFCVKSQKRMCGIHTELCD